MFKFYLKNSIQKTKKGSVISRHESLSIPLFCEWFSEETKSSCHVMQAKKKFIHKYHFVKSNNALAWLLLLLWSASVNPFFSLSGTL